MAWAGIPPTGGIYEAEKRRQNRMMEMYSPDPVLRYKLREERISGNLVAVSRAAISQAKENVKELERLNNLYK